MLIELFKRKGVNATFYFTGEAAKENPEIIRLVAENGNEVGCHLLYHETLGDELLPIPGLKAVLPFSIDAIQELLRGQGKKFIQLVKFL